MATAQDRDSEGVERKGDGRSHSPVD